MQFSCCCGRLLSEHKLIVQKDPGKPGEKWSLENVVEDGPTDAFGEVRFVNNNDHVAKVYSFEKNLKLQLIKFFSFSIYEYTIKHQQTK
jgi:hypothetical protein